MTIICLAIELEPDVKVDVESIKDTDGNNLEIRRALFSELKGDGINEVSARKAKEILLKEAERVRADGNYGEALDIERIANEVKECFHNDTNDWF